MSLPHLLQLHNVVKMWTLLSYVIVRSLTECHLFNCKTLTAGSSNHIYRDSRVKNVVLDEKSWRIKAIYFEVQFCIVISRSRPNMTMYYTCLIVIMSRPHFLYKWMSSSSSIFKIETSFEYNSIHSYFQSEIGNWHSLSLLITGFTKLKWWSSNTYIMLVDIDCVSLDMYVFFF